MKAMLLAAGFGTRLRPLTETIPKPLLSVGEHSILGWNLLLLKRHGITEVLINLHYKGEQIVEALGDGSRYGMRVAYSHEPTILGTGGSIRQAEPFLKGEPFLVLNGDTLSECDLTTMIGAHRTAHRLYRAPATLAVREDPDAARWGPVTVDSDDHIFQINGTPPLRTGDPPRAPYMFAGIHVMEPVIFGAIPAGLVSIIDVYVNLLREGQYLKAYRMHGYWSDLGTPDRYAEAKRDVAEGRFGRA
jgi:NDP-sugar pyrophosphorylase family protein